MAGTSAGPEAVRIRLAARANCEILDIARDLSFHDSFTVTEMAMRHERAENVEHNATGKLGGIVVHIVGGETTTSMPHKPSAAIV